MRFPPVAAPLRVGIRFHPAVLCEDREPLGELDDNDLVIHTYHGVAEIRPFSQLPYRGSAFRVMRWPAPSDRSQEYPDNRGLRHPEPVLTALSAEILRDEHPVVGRDLDTNALSPPVWSEDVFAVTGAVHPALYGPAGDVRR